MTEDSKQPRNVCVVGGGRWARTIARTLAKILPDGSSLALCSPSNAEAWADLRKEFAQGSVAAEICDFEQAIKRTDIELLIVARSARDNAATAIAGLKSGKSVFVEKPFALDCASAQEVLQASSPGQCVTGLVFLFASNLHRFCDSAKSIGRLQSIDIQWQDPASEIRYSETKTYDQSLNCVTDSFPHIWSILRLIAPDSVLEPVEVEAQAGGRIAHLKLRLEAADVNVTIAREASRRIRTVRIEGERGQAHIDFSTEPGEASLNGSAVDVGTGFSSPLELELKAFLNGSTPSIAQVERAFEAISIADIFVADTRAQQVRQILADIRSADREAIRDTEYALREIGLDILLNKMRSSMTEQSRMGTILRDWLAEHESKAALPAELVEEPLLAQLRQNVLSTVGPPIFLR